MRTKFDHWTLFTGWAPSVITGTFSLSQTHVHWNGLSVASVVLLTLYAGYTVWYFRRGRKKIASPEMGDDNTIVGDAPEHTMGSRNTIVGPTDGTNTVINRGGTAIGAGAHADATSVAIGSGAGAGDKSEEDEINSRPSPPRSPEDEKQEEA